MSNKPRKEALAEKAAAKKARREAAAKKAKQKKTVTITAIVLIAVVFVGLIVFAANLPSDKRVFANGNYAVTLHNNGTFRADLCGYSTDGTYTETTEDSSTTVSFITGNESADGSISDDILTIPSAWDEGHDHGNTLWLQ